MDTRDTGSLHLSGDAAVAGLDLFAHALRQHRDPVAPPPQNPCTLPADPPPEALAVCDVLWQAICRRHAITAPAIAAAAGLWPDLRDADRGTRVRELITTWYEAMQMPGRVLVSGSCGYWHSDDAAEITHYHQSLISRICDIATRARRVRLVAQATGRYTYHGRGHWAREVTTTT